MNKVIIVGAVVFSAIITSCGSSSSPETPVQQDTAKAAQTIPQDTVAAPPASDTLRVTGVISKIENGKDGYMATLKDSTGKEFVATISIVNLQKGNSKFKRYNTGEKITVSGQSWKDDSGMEHITVRELQ
ncbi:MAG: hypothetical protein EOO01_35310 [Chitinophagaceae bacterium]|nr:MAG: hypothetical protein EOO01_35310 [Chitinophagaceae bacterium]